MARFTRVMYRRRRWVVAAWLLLLVVLSGLAGRFGGDDTTDYGTPGSESSAANDLLDERFPDASGDTIEVVWTADDVTDGGVRSRVDALLRSVGRGDHVAGVSEGPPSSDRTVGFATLQLDTWDMPVGSTRAILELAEEASGDGLTVELAGNPVQTAEQGEVGSEGIGLLVAAVILLISFGSLLAMGLPIVSAVLGVGVASGFIALLASLVDVPDWATSVATMIAIGVGIDYSLLIVTRYRAALGEGLDPGDAVVEAAGTAGRSVVFAGATVMVSLLGMVVMRLPYLHGVAFGSALAVGVMVALSVTLLPAVLGFVGRNIDRLHVPFVETAVPERSLAHRWSRAIQRRPWPAALGGLLLLLALAFPATGLRLGFPDAGNGPESLSSRRAYDLLTDAYGPGRNGTLLVVADLADGGDLGDVDRLRNELAVTPGVASVADPIVDEAGSTAVLGVVPTTSPQDEATEVLLRTVRDEVVPNAVAGTGLEVRVGGLTAGFLDQSEAIGDRLPLFIAAVVGLSFVLLLTVFRSVLVSVKAAVLNLLSVFAAYGVISLAADGGWFGELLGIQEQTPVPAFIPMMMFAILFGLSMDYEVFLLSRIREEYVRTGDNSGSVADGLATTARVITAAAAIMVAVFGAFVPSDQVFLKLIGIGLATAILVDATVVRMVLVPATMQLLGDRNWWLPSWLARWLPTVTIEGPATIPDHHDEPAVERVAA
ncbi:MAG TPA: MMPL family transporter [Acidimicrobiales bacterium]|nr:MMPL family transporter [Acidimicrobiales bacterium]